MGLINKKELRDDLDFIKGFEKDGTGFVISFGDFKKCLQPVEEIEEPEEVVVKSKSKKK